MIEKIEGVMKGLEIPIAEETVIAEEAYVVAGS